MKKQGPKRTNGADRRSDHSGKTQQGAHSSLLAQRTQERPT